MRRGSLSTAVCSLLIALSLALPVHAQDESTPASAGTQSAENSAENSPQNSERLAYRLLGVKSDASADEINEAYEHHLLHNFEEMKADEAAKNRAEITNAYVIVSNPKLRAAYDLGKGDGISSPFEREGFNELLNVLDPGDYKKVREIGQKTADMGVETATFFTLMAGVTLAKCLTERDRAPCDAYLESWKHPSGWAGLPAFAGSTKLMTLGAKGIVNLKAAKALLARLRATPEAVNILTESMGFAAGSVAVDAFWRIYEDPNFAACMGYDAAGKRDNPDACQKLKRNSVGSREFYWGLAPGAVSGSAAATMISLNLSFRGIPKLIAKFRKRNCVAAALESTVQPDKPPGVLAKAWESTKGLGDFLALQNLLGILTVPLIQAIHTPGNPATARQDIPSVSDQMKPDAFRNLVVSDARRWDAYRRGLMTKVDEIAQPHLKSVSEFDATFQKPLDVYQWLLSGAPKDESWEDLKTRYFSARTNPDDVRRWYTRQFFCGPSPEAVFHPKIGTSVPIPRIESPITRTDGSLALNWPLDFGASSEPFGVAKAPGACDDNSGERLVNYSGEQTREALMRDHAGDFKKAFYEAEARYQNAAVPARNREINDYEKRIEGSLARALLGSGKKGPNGVPDGIMPSFSAEIEDLQKARIRIKDPAKVAFISEMMAAVAFEQQAAAELLAYITTPAAKRVKPDETLSETIRLLQIGGFAKKATRTQYDDWKDVVASYESYLKRDAQESPDNPREPAQTPQ